MNNSSDDNECQLLITVADHTNDTILTVIYSCIGVFIIITNTALLFGLPRLKKNLTRFDRLFLLQSSVDLLVGVVLMPFEVYLIYKNFPITCLDVGIKTMVNGFTSVLSGLVTCLITNDRYLLITKDQFHVKYMTTKVIVAIVVVMVLIAVFWGIFALHVTLLDLDKGKTIFFLSFGIFAALLLIEVICVNILLFRHLTKAAKIIRNTNQTVARPNQYQNYVNKTILIISIALVIAYLPTILGFCVGSTIALIRNSTGISATGTKILTYVILPTNLNSGLNSFIFIIRNRGFRRHIKSAFGIASLSEVHSSYQVR